MLQHSTKKKKSCGLILPISIVRFVAKNLQAWIQDSGNGEEHGDPRWAKGPQLGGVQRHAPRESFLISDSKRCVFLEDTTLFHGFITNFKMNYNTFFQYKPSKPCTF